MKQHLSDLEEALRVLVALGLLLGGITTSMAQGAQEIARDIFQKTVVLLMQDAQGQQTAIGSGFVVGPGIVATNWHVLRGSARGYIKFIGNDWRIEITGAVAIDAERDLALVAANTDQTTAVRFGDSDALQVGEGVYVAGAPRGLEGTFSNGIISGIRNLSGARLIQITAPVSPGSSGGPVINQQGAVIGVAVATFRDGQNLNFAVPANNVRELMKKATKPVALAAATSAADKTAKPSAVGPPISSAVIGRQLTFDNACSLTGFSVSFVNNLRDPVRDVFALVTFYDSSNQPLDTVTVQVKDVIMPGLAKRIRGFVDESVGRMVTGQRGNCLPPPPILPQTRADILVLDFKIVQ